MDVLGTILWSEGPCHRVGFLNGLDYVPAWTAGYSLFITIRFWDSARSPRYQLFGTVWTLLLCLAWHLVENPSIGYVTEYYSHALSLSAWFTIIAVLSPQLTIFFAYGPLQRKHRAALLLSSLASIASIAALAGRNLALPGW